MFFLFLTTYFNSSHTTVLTSYLSKIMFPQNKINASLSADMSLVQPLSFQCCAPERSWCLLLTVSFQCQGFHLVHCSISAPKLSGYLDILIHLERAQCEGGHRIRTHKCQTWYSNTLSPFHCNDLLPLVRKCSSRKASSMALETQSWG